MVVAGLILFSSPVLEYNFSRLADHCWYTVGVGRVDSLVK